MPFTPPDMTPSEKTLLATVVDQTIAARGAVTADEVDRAVSEAEQTAAEMIWAQRSELTTPEPEEPFDEYLRSYYEILQAQAEMNRMLPDEDELGFIVEENPGG